MHTSLHRMVPALLCLLAGCGGGGGGGAPAPEPAVIVPPPLEAGTGTVGFAIPAGGVLTTDTVITTDEGLTLTLVAGTSIETVLGAHVQGPVTIGIDDAGGSDLWPGVAGQIGVARVYLLLGPTGAETLTAVHFDPPAVLEVPLTSTAGGAFGVHTWLDGDGAYHLGPPLGEAPDLSGFGPVNVGMAGSVDNADVAVFRVTNTCVLGATFVEPGPPATGPLDPKPSSGASTHMTVSYLHEMELPPDADGVPVKAVQIINPETAQIVKTFNADGDGWSDNEGEGFSGEGALWTVVIVRKNGKRIVQVRTNFKNDFVIEVTLCDRADQPTAAVSAGSSGETDRDAEYVGGIKLKISGWGGFRDFINVRNTIRNTRSVLWGQATRSFNAHPAGGSYYACIEFFDFSDSTHDLADMFPPGWATTPGDREIEIEIPCPPPVLAMTTYVARPQGGGGAQAALHLLDPGTLGVQQTIPLPAQEPEGLFVLPGGQGAFLAVTDAMHVFDFSGPPVPAPPLAIPGLGPAFGVSPTQQHLFVPLPSDEFMALDLETGLVAWQAPFPSGGPYTFTDVAVAPDGSRAYVGTAGGLVFPVDLLRQQVLPGISTTAANSLDVSPDSQQVAVADSGANGIRFLAPASGAVTPLIPTGTQPAQVLYAPDGTMVLVAHQGFNTLGFVDPQTQAVQTMQMEHPALLGVAVFPDLGGNPMGVTIFMDHDQMQQFPLNPLGTPLPVQPVPPRATLVRTNGQ